MFCISVYTYSADQRKRKILGRLEEKGLLITSLAAHSLTHPPSFFRSFFLSGPKRVYRKSLESTDVAGKMR